MELVYLWVKEYKNIKEQGFNFSSSDNYSYDKDTHLLTSQKINYNENFFGDNIKITALVGKNGSGKSSIFEVLSQILNIKDDLNYFYIISYKHENICYSCNIDVSTELNLKVEKYIPMQIIEGKKIQEKRNQAVALSNYFDMYYLNISHLERDGLIRNDVPSPEDKLKYLGVYAKNDFELSSDKSILPTFTTFNPTRFSFFQVAMIAKLLTDKKYETLFFDLMDIKKPHFIKIDILEHELQRILKDNKYNPISPDRTIDESVPQKIQDILDFLENTNSNIIKIQDDEFEEFFTLAGKIYDSLSLFKLRFLTEGKKEIKFSAGEKTFFYYLERVDYMLCEVEKKKQASILLFDEIELYLHPIWQKKIFNILIQFIKEKKLDSLVHIIIATHSPFLLSDLPKGDVVFLKDGKQIDVKIDTFGANIHTLLSHGFFMDEGLIGDFSNNKIQEIIGFYKLIKDEEEKTESNFDTLISQYKIYRPRFRSICEVIGEAYLRQMIDNHILEMDNILLGISKAKEDRIKYLRAEADRLEGIGSD